MTKEVLYKKILEFLNWVNEESVLEHSDIKDVTDGMTLLTKGVSADVGIWMKWEESVSEDVPLDKTFKVLEIFLKHWKNAYNLRVFNRLLYMFDSKDIDYNEMVCEKWNLLMNEVAKK